MIKGHLPSNDKKAYCKQLFYYIIFFHFIQLRPCIWIFRYGPVNLLCLKPGVPYGTFCKCVGCIYISDLKSRWLFSLACWISLHCVCVRFWSNKYFTKQKYLSDFANLAIFKWKQSQDEGVAGVCSSTTSKWWSNFSLTRRRNICLTFALMSFLNRVMYSH